MEKILGVSLLIGGVIGNSYFKAMETAEARSARLGKQWDKTNARLGATGNVIKYRNLLGQLREKQARLGTSSKRLNDGIQETERRYKDAKRAARGYGVEIGRVAKEHAQLSKELKHTERQQRRLEKRQEAGARLGQLRGRFLGLAGAAYGMSRLTGGAMMREEEGLYLRTVINAQDGDKDAAVARARLAAKAFARESLASEQEVLQIEYALNSAGLQEEASRAGAAIVHKLAKVTRGMPEQVGEIFGVTFNNMGAAMEGTAEEKMERIGNVLAKTQFKFQIRDFGQLGESMKYAAASAVDAKLPLEQTAAVIGQLNSAGLQGSMAGTAFGAVMRNLTKASGELGFEIVRDEKGELDLIATLEQIKGQLDGLDTDERSDLLQKIFGDEGKRGIVPLIDQLDQLKDAYRDVSNAASSGLVNEEYKRFLQSSSGQLTRFTQNLAQVGDVFAGTLLPAVNTFLDPAAKVAGWTASMIDRFPVIGEAIGFVGAAAASVGIGMGLWATTIWMVNTALAANPIGLVIGAVILAVGLIYKYWEPISGFFLGLWEGIKSSAFAIWEGIKIGFLNYTPYGLIYQHWGSIVGYFGGLWTSVKNAFAMGWEAIKLSVSTWADDFMSIGSAIIDGLIGGIMGKIASVKETVTGVGSSISGWFKGVLGIQSPSRVFMGLGTNVSEGLAIGIQKGQAGVMQQMEGIRSGIAAPMVAGGIGMAALATPAAATEAHDGPGLQATTPPASIIYSPQYTITLSGGGDAAAMEEMVRRVLAEHEARTQADLRRLLND